MNEQEVRAEVKQALEGGETTPPVVETPVAVAETVKTETTPAEETTPVVAEPKTEENKVAEATRLQEQVSNLNIALKQERDAKRQDQEKIAELEKSLSEVSESMGVLGKMKEVFAPAPQTVVEQPPTYLTAEQAEQFWQQKEQERINELTKNQQVAAIKGEIETLEKEWDGTSGKPKYDDQEVLNWQQANNKLYLSPTEAFSMMHRNEIVDWEVNQRLSGRKPTAEVERPGSGAIDHTPAEKTPQNDQELKQAIREAMDKMEEGI